MSATVEDLLDRLWTSRALKRDAREGAENLDAVALRQLEDIAGLLRDQSARRRATRATAFTTGIRSDPLTTERLAGLLELLTLARFHSDTLLYLPHEEREARLLDWAKRTGFHPDLVREATVLGPVGIDALLKAA